MFSTASTCSLGRMTGVLTCHCGNTGLERKPIKSQHTELTLEKKILPPLLPGFQLAAFQSRVRRSYQQAISTLLSQCMILRVFFCPEKILKFESGADRTTCVKKIENFLQQIGVNRQVQEVPTNNLFRDADTYDDRKKLLEKFFRTVTLRVSFFFFFFLTYKDVSPSFSFFFSFFSSSPLSLPTLPPNFSPSSIRSSYSYY